VFTEKLQIGLLGLGKMGSYHLEKLLQHPKVHLVGVYDTDSSRSHEVAQDTGVTAYSNYEDLLFDADAVFIASPTATHYEFAKKALDNNLHVFVEKPMCERLEQASDLVRISHAKNLVLQTGFVERYRWLSLMTELQKKPQQKPLLISAERQSTVPSREKGMDVISDLMVHDIDLALWMVQEPPSSFAAEGFSAGLTEIDLAYVRLEFPSGTVAHLKANWISPKRYRDAQVVWNDKVINFDLLNGMGHILEIGTEETSENKTISMEKMDPLMDQVDAFVQAVQESKRPIVSGVDGLRALEVAEAIKQKIRDKQAEKVRLSPLERKFLSRFWGDYAH